MTAHFLFVIAWLPNSILVGNRKSPISNPTRLPLSEVFRRIESMFVTSKIRVVTPRQSTSKHCFNACLPSFKAFFGLKRPLLGIECMLVNTSLTLTMCQVSLTRLPDRGGIYRFNACKDGFNVCKHCNEVSNYFREGCMLLVKGLMSFVHWVEASLSSLSFVLVLVLLKSTFMSLYTTCAPGSFSPARKRAMR